MKAHLINEQSATIYFDGMVVTVPTDLPEWPRIEAALRAGSYEDAVLLARSALEAAKKQLLGSTALELRGSQIFYGEHLIPDSITKRIIKMHEAGFNIAPMDAFIRRLYENPSNRSIQELYNFLSVNNLPITEDGCFLAYKRINDDWTDVYSRSIDNRVGRVVSMPRHSVDDNCNNTCSHGLHFASLEYLKYYTGNRLVALKISPADVVSIPIDYNNSKGRCSRYQVIEELPIELVKGEEDAWDSPVISTYVGVYDDYSDDDLDWNKWSGQTDGDFWL